MGRNITLFFGPENPMSQFHPADFVEADKSFTCAEQYMMYHKAVLFGDDRIADEILATHYNPRKYKSLGRKVESFDEAKWKQHREEIVYNGNVLKFSQNPDLSTFLLATKENILAEASPFDRIWGIGLGEKERDAYNVDKWKGSNLLGYALMRVRTYIRSSTNTNKDIIES